MLLNEIRNDQKLFDDLTNVMKTFKKSIDLLAKLSTQFLTDQHSNSNSNINNKYLEYTLDNNNHNNNEKLLTYFHNQIKELISYFQTTSNYYKMDQYFYESRQSFTATFNRFSCRIIQTLSYSKMKTINNMGQSPFKMFIDQAFIIINTFRSQLNFALFLKKIALLLKRVSKKIPSKFNQTIANHSVIQGIDQQRIHHHQGITNRQKPQKKNKTTSQLKINKIMEAFKKSYTSFSIMEIQYIHYRNAFFQAKSSATNQQLYEDCLQRNKLITGQINLYNKKFYQYKNKGNSPTRKTKHMNISQNNSKPKAKTSKNSSPQHQLNQQIKQKKKQIFNMTKNNIYRYSNKVKPIVYNQIKTQSPPIYSVSQQFIEKQDNVAYELPKMKTVQKIVINLNESKDIFLKSNYHSSSGYQFLTGKTLTNNLNYKCYQNKDQKQCLENQNSHKNEQNTFQSVNKKKIQMNQVLINGNKLKLAPIRGIQEKQIVQSINEKKMKIQNLLKIQKQKIFPKGSYMSVGHVNNVINSIKMKSHTNIFKLQNQGYRQAV